MRWPLDKGFYISHSLLTTNFSFFGTCTIGRSVAIEGSCLMGVQLYIFSVENFITGNTLCKGKFAFFGELLEFVSNGRSEKNEVEHYLVNLVKAN